MAEKDVVRIEYLDQLKGIGIFLVVMGHFVEPYRQVYPIINSIFIIIYTFHMPLFCLLSGMVAKPNVKKIFLRMVWIYLLSQLLYLAFCMITDRENYIRGGKQFVRKIVYPYWHMWYLYALIIWLLSLILIEKLEKYVTKHVILIAYGGIMLGSGYINLPLALTRVVVFYVFFIMGYLYKDMLLPWMKRKRRSCSYLVSVTLLAVIFIAIGMFAENINANTLWEYLSYAEGNYTLGGRLTFCVGAIVICLLILSISTSYKSTLFIKLGKNTLSIYIFHAVFVKVFDILEANINMEYCILHILGRFAMAVCVVLFLQLDVIQKIIGKIWDVPLNRWENKAIK